MNQTILIHGSPYKDEFYKTEKPSPSNTNWFPWLQKQIALKNGLCQALEYPKPFDPLYENWLEVFKQQSLEKNSIVIGHSCGGGFLLRFFSENPNIKVEKIILVAPWLDPENELTTDFFNFSINSNIQDINTIHVFISSDDSPDLLTSFEIIKKSLPKATYHEYSDKGHFCGKEFPEILNLL